MYMVNYGKYIKINRYLQKKSISELCDGICTPSTLSKIENNKSNINPKIINQILERLSNINIDILEANTNRLKPLTELFIQRLMLNLDRSDLMAKIEKEQYNYLHSEYILFFYIAKLFSNFDLYHINNKDIGEETLDLISEVIEFGDFNELYFYNLLKIIRYKNTNNRLRDFEKIIDGDRYGWLNYFYCDILFHNGNINEAYMDTKKCYELACENCNINLMYGCLLLLGLCSLELSNTNESVKYFKKLENLAPFMKYDINFVINYNLGATMLEKKNIEKAKYYLEALEADKYAFSISSFFVVHKLGYLYTELKEYEKANYYINWINEFASRQDSKISNLLKKISDSLAIKLKEPDYLSNKEYQEDIEFIFQNSQNIFSYGFQKFYLADLEEVYLIQRRYKELYYIYKNR